MQSGLRVRRAGAAFRRMLFNQVGSLSDPGVHMKWKNIIYGILAISVVFAGLMGYLFVGNLERGNSSSVLSQAVSDRGATVSRKAGKAIIAYTGDMIGNLEPCG
jgi:hypothetical protein